MSKSLVTKIGFLGQESIYSKEVENCLMKCNNTDFPVELNYFEPGELTIQSIIDNKIKALVVDMSFDCDNYDRLFMEIKNCFYPENLFVFAFCPYLKADSLERIQKLGIHFIYHRMGKGSDETKFLVESVMRCLFPASKLKNDFAVAKIKQDTIVQVPLNIKKISASEIIYQSNFKPQEKEILALHNSYIKKLNWKDTKLSVIKSEHCNTSLFNWKTTLKNEMIKPEEIDSFEASFPNLYPEKATDKEFKKQEMMKKLKMVSQEKKTNLLNFYRRHRFDCDPRNRKPVMLISQQNLNFRLKGEELIENFILYKKNLINPSISIIKKISPQIIFFELEEVPAEITEKTLFKYNDIETFRYFIYKLQESKLEIPVVLFLPPNQAEKINLGLELVKEVNISFCEKFVSAFLKEKINEDKKTSQIKFNSKEAPEPEIWPSERNFSGFGFADVAVKIEALSETEILIEANAELPEYTLIKAAYPFPCFITLIPNSAYPPIGKYRRYHGFISGISSEQRDLLRKFVITFNKDNAA